MWSTTEQKRMQLRNPNPSNLQPTGSRHSYVKKIVFCEEIAQSKIPNLKHHKLKMLVTHHRRTLPHCLHNFLKNSTDLATWVPER